jgi:hypothetical protein
MSRKYKAMGAWLISANLAHDMKDRFGELHRLRLLKQVITEREEKIRKELYGDKNNRTTRTTA